LDRLTQNNRLRPRSRSGLLPASQPLARNDATYMVGTQTKQFSEHTCARDCTYRKRALDAHDIAGPRYRRAIGHAPK